MNVNTNMKTIDVIVAVLVVVGGLNWGLVGVANFNLVEYLFGTTLIARIVYVVVGLCALWQVFGWKQIQHRWVHPTMA